MRKRMWDRREGVERTEKKMEKAESQNEFEIEKITTIMSKIPILARQRRQRHPNEKKK